MKKAIKVIAPILGMLGTISAATTALTSCSNFVSTDTIEIKVNLTNVGDTSYWGDKVDSDITLSKYTEVTTTIDDKNPAFYNFNHRSYTVHNIGESKSQSACIFYYNGDIKTFYAKFDKRPDTRITVNCWGEIENKKSFWRNRFEWNKINLIINCNFVSYYSF